MPKVAFSVVVVKISLRVKGRLHQKTKLDRIITIIFTDLMLEGENYV